MAVSIVLNTLANRGGGITRTKIASIELSAVPSKTHSRSAVLTQFPIEDGSPVNDHIIKRPFRFQMDAMVSNVQLLGSSQSAARFPNVISAAVPIGLTILSLATGNAKEQAHNKLVQLFENSEPFDLVTSLRSYRNMVFITFDINEDTTTGDSLAFTATLEQATIVQSDRVPIDKALFDDEVEEQASKGANTAKPTTPAENEKTKGLIEQGIEFLRKEQQNTIDQIEAIGGEVGVN